MSKIYEDTCTVTCTDNGIARPAEILDFKEEKLCIVTVNRAVKISMHYDAKAKLYIGNNAGLEFTSKGPVGKEIRNSFRG